MSTDEIVDQADEAELRERYRELLEELRTVIPGVTVLLAFLLTAPFSNRFQDLDDLGRDVYAGAVLGVAVAVVVFLTPAAYHRLAQREDRANRLRVSVRLAVFGMGVLAVSLAAAIFVVIRFVFQSTPAGLAVAGVPLGLVILLWYALPILNGRRGEYGPDSA